MDFLLNKVTLFSKEIKFAINSHNICSYLHPYLKNCNKSLSVALKYQQKITLLILAINTSINFRVVKSFHMELAIKKNLLCLLKSGSFLHLLWAVSVHIPILKIYSGSIQHQSVISYFPKFYYDHRKTGQRFHYRDGNNIVTDTKFLFLNY